MNSRNIAIPDFLFLYLRVIFNVSLSFLIDFPFIRKVRLDLIRGDCEISLFPQLIAVATKKLTKISVSKKFYQFRLVTTYHEKLS